MAPYGQHLKGAVWRGLIKAHGSGKLQERARGMERVGDGHVFGGSADAARNSTQVPHAVSGDYSTGDVECDTILNRMFSFLEEQCCDEDGALDWRTTTNAKGVQVDSRQVSAPVKLVRGQGFIRAHPTEVLDMIRDASKRPMWDNMCDYGSVVKTYSPNSDLIYLSYQGKLGVCARDLSLLRAWKEFEDGTYMLVAHSIVDRDIPKVAGKVRAELRDCGYVIKPCGEGSMLSYVIQLDMKGYVPLFFTNLIQTQHPLIISMMRRLLEGGGDADEGADGSSRREGQGSKRH